MRLPFPERVPLGPAACFAGLLFLVQLLQGTDPLFALCSFLFICVATLAFNTAGGFTRPSGGFIFFFSVLVVILGVFWKAVLGEPGDSNLQVPTTTITVYLGSICSMLGAVYISKKLTTKRALLANFVTDENMGVAAAGCAITGIIFMVIFDLVPVEPGSILSAIRQLNLFTEVAILLGTIHAIRQSGGRRCVNLSVLVSCACMFFSGLIGFSKQAMFTPFLAWLITATSQGYRFSVRQMLGIVCVTFFIFQYLVPYSQYGRNFQASSVAGNISVSYSLLARVGEIRTEFLREEAEQNEDLVGGYFSHHQGFFDRLQMVGPDDGLNQLTDQGIVPGFYPVVLYVENLAPHFLWKDKTNWGGGNLYGRQMGIIGDDDESTGISFSPAGEAFHLMRWTGVFVLMPVLMIIMFTMYDSLCGDTRKSPWGLLVIVIFSHIAPEGSIGVLIYSLGYATLGIVFIAFTSAYVMPYVGQLLLGSSRNKAVTAFANRVQSRPSRIHSANPSGNIVR